MQKQSLLSLRAKLVIHDGGGCGGAGGLGNVLNASELFQLVAI